MEESKKEDGADRNMPKKKKRKKPFFLRHSFYLQMTQSSTFSTCVYLAIIGSRYIIFRMRVAFCLLALLTFESVQCALGV